MSEESLLETLNQFGQYWDNITETLVLFCKNCDLTKTLWYHEMVQLDEKKPVQAPRAEDFDHSPRDLKNVVHHALHHVCGEEKDGWKKDDEDGWKKTMTDKLSIRYGYEGLVTELHCREHGFVCNWPREKLSLEHRKVTAAIDKHLEEKHIELLPNGWRKDLFSHSIAVENIQNNVEALNLLIQQMEEKKKRLEYAIWLATRFGNVSPEEAWNLSNEHFILMDIEDLSEVENWGS